MCQAAGKPATAMIAKMQPANSMQAAPAVSIKCTLGASLGAAFVRGSPSLQVPLGSQLFWILGSMQLWGKRMADQGLRVQWGHRAEVWLQELECVGGAAWTK
jgi:hypothetical protein